MSQWLVHVVDPWDRRLTDPKDDFIIPDWRWEKNRRGEYDLVANIGEPHPEMRCLDSGVAHAFLLANPVSARKVHSTFMYDRTVCEGAIICCTEIRVEGDLVYLIEEYLPTRPPLL